AHPCPRPIFQPPPGRQGDLMDTLQTPHRQPRILVVDDEELVRTMLARLLESKYHCDTTGCTEEALALLDHNEYELVMSDISMPGRDGLDLLSDVRARNPQAVVVMISGLQNQRHTIEALRRGAFDYITKPFRLAGVECGIERAHQSAPPGEPQSQRHVSGPLHQLPRHAPGPRGGARGAPRRDRGPLEAR